MKTCKYFLPCGKCDKYDEYCNLDKEDLINYNILIGEISPECAEEIKNASECKHEWRCKGQSDISHHYICTKCGMAKHVPLSNLECNSSTECEHSWEAMNFFITDEYIGINYKCKKCDAVKTNKITKV